MIEYDQIARELTEPCNSVAHLTAAYPARPAGAAVEEHERRFRGRRRRPQDHYGELERLAGRFFAVSRYYEKTTLRFPARGKSVCKGVAVGLIETRNAALRGKANGEKNKTGSGQQTDSIEAIHGIALLGFVQLFDVNRAYHHGQSGSNVIKIS